MIGELYTSHSMRRGSAKFKRIPFHDASIDWNRTEASTLSFSSPVKLLEADRIRYKSPRGIDWGGQVYKVKKSLSGDYDYDCISYHRLYMDKVTCSYKNLTSSQIMKKVLKLSRNNFRTSGVRDTNIVHSNLKWENTSIWDIALQLCWLEHKAGYEVRALVDADGTLNFGYTPRQERGYSFQSSIDYSEETDSSDIITASSIIFNGKEIANATSSKDIIAKWGYVTEIEDCTTEESTSTTSTSGTSADSLRDDKQIHEYGIKKSVVEQALSIAKSTNTPYQNLKLLYKWCDEKIAYEGYSNTHYGASGTLKKRKGNCCDNANLLIAMARSIGIKARYCHAKQGSNGHVYGEYKVKGWFVCDTGVTSTGRYWGKHWNGFGGTDKRYDTLPF